MVALRQKIIDASESGDVEAVIQADREYNKLFQERNNSAKDIIKYKKDLVKQLEKESGQSSLLESWPGEDLRIKKLKTEITILEKYKEYPKIIKKLYGTEPKKITDGKGNTWYEFNIPYEFKEGPAEIKAFRYGGTNNKLAKFIR
jgi:hypothetical protein